MKKRTVLLLALSVASTMLFSNEAKNEREILTAESESAEEITESVSKEESSSVKSVSFIGEEKAKEISAGNSGINAQLIEFEKIELNEDNGVWMYNMNFSHGSDIYHVEINAENGDIIVWETKKK